MISKYNIEENPLVSIVVVTYNSAGTVLETLESIKAQTYNNIELIISDDCSSDNTVELCENWLSENKERFENVTIVTALGNTGTSGNLNRGIVKCNGLWIKDIAGDDRLLPSCIRDNVNFSLLNPNADIIFSKVRMFGIDTFVNDNQTLFKYHYFNYSPKKFYRKLIQRNFLPGASSFIKKTVFSQIGLYDESIPLLEDWPFWMKACRYGCVFCFNDIETVEYRVEGSVSISEEKSPKYLECEVAANKMALEYQKEYSIWLWMFTKTINALRIFKVF